MSHIDPNVIALIVGLSVTLLFLGALAIGVLLWLLRQSGRRQSGRREAGQRDVIALHRQERKEMLEASDAS
jgi:hypothetical protein